MLSGTFIYCDLKFRHLMPFFAFFPLNNPNLLTLRRSLILPTTVFKNLAPKWIRNYYIRTQRGKAHLDNY